VAFLGHFTHIVLIHLHAETGSIPDVAVTVLIFKNFTVLKVVEQIVALIVVDVGALLLNEGIGSAEVHRKAGSQSDGAQRTVGATETSKASAMAAIFLVSQIPPQWLTSGWIISTPPFISMLLKPQRVKFLSPVARGMQEAALSRANSSSFSQRTGSSTNIRS